ncbi:LysR family transcriptional regulator [Vibrio sp. 10N]|uniref:LysR family transcriptional regulator n=1 Tax=Vibrio sp. 10N TaxID=3058938 RepID=UPI0030C67F2C
MALEKASWMSKSIKNLDLNLLTLLKVVVETRNVSQAGEILGISQTSVSRGMAKLRETFGDQLFIRKAHGVEPSELAEKLAEAADNMLTPFTEVLDAYSSFEPHNHEGSIVIAFELSLLEIFGRGIYQALADALPKASLSMVYWQQDTLSQILDRHVDYLVHFEPYSLPQDIYTHHLSDIKINLVARKNHPVLSQTSDWEVIHKLPMVKLFSDAVSAKSDPYTNALFTSKGYTANIVLNTHSIPIAVDKLTKSDAFKFSSSYLLTHSDELSCYPLPIMPKELRSVSVVGGYLQAKRGYPLNQYLHQTIQSFFNKVLQPDIELDKT